jgi:hypothetical protein
MTKDTVAVVFRAAKYGPWAPAIVVGVIDHQPRRFTMELKRAHGNADTDDGILDLTHDELGCIAGGVNQIQANIAMKQAVRDAQAKLAAYD